MSAVRRPTTFIIILYSIADTQTYSCYTSPWTTQPIGVPTAQPVVAYILASKNFVRELVFTWCARAWEAALLCVALPLRAYTANNTESIQLTKWWIFVAAASTVASMVEWHRVETGSEFRGKFLLNASTVRASRDHFDHWKKPYIAIFFSSERAALRFDLLSAMKNDSIAAAVTTATMGAMIFSAHFFHMHTQHTLYECFYSLFYCHPFFPFDVKGNSGATVRTRML